MRKAVLILILAAAPALAGDLVLKNEKSGAELRLLGAPCTHGETLGVLKEEWRPRFKNARIVNAKGRIEAYGCWIQHDDDTALVILQDGSALTVRLSAMNDPSV